MREQLSNSTSVGARRPLVEGVLHGNVVVVHTKMKLSCPLGCIAVAHLDSGHRWAATLVRVRSISERSMVWCRRRGPVRALKSPSRQWPDRDSGEQTSPDFIAACHCSE